MPDEAKLTCRIKHALIALYQAEEHLPPAEPTDSKLRLEFRTQIDRLRTKLSQIAGPEALEQFDTQRRAGQPSGSGSGGGPPGGGGGGGGSSAAAGVGGSGSGSSAGVGSGAGAAGLSSGAYPSLPGRMTNEQLAHELLLDPTFQLD